MIVPPHGPMLASADRAQRRRSIPLVRKLIYSALVVMFVFGLPEAALRLFWSPPVQKTPAVGTRQFVNWLSQLSADVRTEARTQQPLYRPDSKLLWRLQPDSRIRSYNPHFAPTHERRSINITINEEGYRGRKTGSPSGDGVTRVLCLGDSNFFGYPLDDQDAFPSALEGTLQKHCHDRNWEVINGGVPGYTVVQGWLWYQSAFQSAHFDILLLSFLNNDAWAQPQADLDLLKQSGSPLATVGELARRSRLVQWAESVSRQPVPQDRYVARVAKEDYVAHYRLLIDAAQKKGTRVIILDYRAYEQYAPYSRELQALAKERHVEYFSVREQMETAFKDPAVVRRFPKQADRVQRRWGNDMLRERPHLWVFAEVYPEHLNEIGTALLAELLSDGLCQKGR